MTGWAKVKDIARYMSLSERTVRGLLNAGLRKIRLETGTILVKYEWADEFLEKYEVQDNEVDQVVNQIMKEI